MGILSRRGLTPIPGATFELENVSRMCRRWNSSGNLDALPTDQIAVTSRGTVGWAYGQSGKLTEFAINTLRHASNPVTRATLGILTEPGTTNSNPASDNFSAWFANAATIVANAAPDIRGGFAANLLSSTASGGFISYELSIASTSQYWSHSFVVSSTAQMKANFALLTSSGSGYVVEGAVTFDPVLGRISSITNTVGTTFAKIEAAPDGKWRVTLWGNNSSGALFINVLIGFVTTGTATLESSQIEPLAGNSTIIPTSGTAVLRAYDLPTVDLTANNSWWNQAQGTLYIEAIHNGPLNAQQYLLCLSDGTNNNMLTLVYDPSSGNYYWYGIAAGVTVGFISMAGSARGSLLRFALTFINGSVWNAAKTGGGMDYTLDAPAGLLASASSIMPTVAFTRMDIGHAFGNGAAHLIVPRLGFIPWSVSQTVLSDLVQV